jgi:hypothetical protein
MRYVNDEAGEIRASDGERDEVAARLSGAVGRGQLTLAEFSERVAATYGSRTRGELDRVIADLPVAPQSSAPQSPAPQPAGSPASGLPAYGAQPGTGMAVRPKRRWSVAVVGGIRRTGHWRVPERSVTVTLVGGADLNLRDAQLEAPRVEITHVSIVGGIQLRVPPGVRVEVEGFTVLGGKSLKLDEAAIHPSAPTIVVRGFCLLGGIDVRTALAV